MFSSCLPPSRSLSLSLSLSRSLLISLSLSLSPYLSPHLEKTKKKMKKEQCFSFSLINNYFNYSQDPPERERETEAGKMLDLI